MNVKYHSILIALFLYLLNISTKAFSTMDQWVETTLTNHLSRSNDELVRIVSCENPGFDTEFCYKATTLKSIYFLKVVDVSAGNIYARIFNKQKNLLRNSGLGGQLAKSNAEFIFPVHDSEHIGFGNCELLIFPYINGFVLEDIPRKLSFSEAIKIAKLAYFLYGRSMATIHSTPVESDEDNLNKYLNIPDQKTGNLMYDPQNNKLYFFDTVTSVPNFHHIESFSSYSHSYFPNFHDEGSTIKEQHDRALYQKTIREAYKSGYESW